MSLADNLKRIREDIAGHAGGRPVTLIAVSKYVSLDQILEAYDLGIVDFGENRVPDALHKMDALPAELQSQIHWHLLGPLQSNKVNKTVGHFDSIQSVASVALAQKISQANCMAGRRQRILIQVNTTQDASRHGVPPHQLIELISAVQPLPGVHIAGLMAMAPPALSLSRNFKELEHVFGQVRQLGGQAEKACGISFSEYSMGMSHDYVAALKHGATQIRIGNGLFKN